MGDEDSIINAYVGIKILLGQWLQDGTNSMPLSGAGQRLCTSMFFVLKGPKKTGSYTGEHISAFAMLHRY